MSEIAENGADADEFMEKINGWMVKLVASSSADQFQAAARANPRNSSSGGSAEGSTRTNPPTSKMKALAKKVAEKNKVKLPRGYTKSFDKTREFLDQQLGAQKAR